jgi:tellurite resistance protein
MGLLTTIVSAPPQFSNDTEHQPLLRTVRAMSFIDGKMEPAEQIVIEALMKTIPQLRDLPIHLATPERVTREQLLAELRKVSSDRLRNQLFVVAIEVALASGHVNEHEDRFAEQLRQALRIEEPYARQVIEVIAAKYGRGR